jgi:hypothetical protein
MVVAAPNIWAGDFRDIACRARISTLRRSRRRRAGKLAGHIVAKSLSRKLKASSTARALAAGYIMPTKFLKKA